MLALLGLSGRTHPRRPALAAVLACLLGACVLVVVTTSAEAASAPAVSGLSTHAGSTHGGARVTVKGRGFTHLRAVRFGSVAGTSVRVLSSTTLRVTTPRHSAGRLDVRVVTRAGRSAPAAKSPFPFVAPPRVSAVTPSSGPTSGGTRVTVTGSGFRGVKGVRFGSTSGAAVFV